MTDPSGPAQGVADGATVAQWEFAAVCSELALVLRDTPELRMTATLRAQQDRRRKAMKENR